MLSQGDRQRLQAIEMALRAEDPQFTEALRAGRPHPPREYRRQLWVRAMLPYLLVTIALAAAVAAAALLS